MPEPEQVLLVKPFLSPAGSEDGTEEEDKQVVEYLCHVVVKSWRNLFFFHSLNVSSTESSMYERIFALKMICIFNNISTTIFYVVIIVTLSTTLSSDNHDP